MLDAIKQFVARRITGGAPSAAGPPGSAGAPAPAPADAHAVQLAACALLLELAHADEEFSSAERAHIESAIRRHFDIDEDTARELITLAQAEREQSVDHFQFARVIAERYDLGQKMVLAEVMWGVILADGRIAAHESYLVRKLGRLLDLAPGYLAEARRAAGSSE